MEFSVNTEKHSSSPLLRSNSTSSRNSTESYQNTHLTLPVIAPSTSTPLSLDSSVEPTSTAAMIEKYSGLLSIFEFERAQEFAEKQYCQKGGDPTWTSLAMVMMQIATFEKQYMNLSFLAPKGFLRKDSNLKGAVEHIKHELRKFSDSSLAKIANEFLIFTSIRQELMEFYEKLCLLGTAKNVEIVDLISDLELLSEKRNDETKPLLESLSAAVMFKSLEWEIETLFNLLKSETATKLWNYFGAIITIQEAQKMTTEWSEHLQQNQLTKKSSFLKSGSTTPSIYNWLLKFKTTLSSKLSLYFYELLSRNSNSAFDIRVISAKFQTDYVSRMMSFQKKTDALAICLVFDARDVDFYPNGYQHPTRPLDVPIGLDTFPAVFSVPVKPLSHWPNVVMLLTGRIADLNSDKLIGFFDSNVQTTYFIVRIEPRMFILCVYESKKSEKENYVLKFMNELVSELRCGKIFSSLKLNTK